MTMIQRISFKLFLQLTNQATGQFSFFHLLSPAARNLRDYLKAHASILD